LRCFSYGFPNAIDLYVIERRLQNVKEKYAGICLSLHLCQEREKGMKKLRNLGVE